jgi:hypothetical protein
MPRFPQKEADFESPAMAMFMGLWGSLVFPEPPVSPAQLFILLKDCRGVEERQIAAIAAAEQAIIVKEDSLEELIEAIKSNIRYAGNTVDFDDDKLKLVGWAGRAEAAARRLWFVSNAAGRRLATCLGRE